MILTRFFRLVIASRRRRLHARPGAATRVWAVALPAVCLAFPLAVSATPCEMYGVDIEEADARVQVRLRGSYQMRRQDSPGQLVLFLDGCSAPAGTSRRASLRPPLHEVRWADHPAQGSVWVVAEFDPARVPRVERVTGGVQISLAGDEATRRRWPLGFRVLHPLPAPVRELVARSWHEDCPVALSGLSLVQLTHLGFDGTEKQGDLVVHHDIADEVVAIFAELLRGGCAIERVQLADLYADDDASMAANNTSAYACRLVTGSSTVYSAHSHGRAIDLNPVQNPYVRGDRVLPPAGRDYLVRGRPVRGLIRRGDACHRPFASRGWTWGGDFESLKDWQHFEKPLP